MHVVIINRLRSLPIQADRGIGNSCHLGRVKVTGMTNFDGDAGPPACLTR